MSFVCNKNIVKGVDCESVVLTGDETAPVFIFIHGFGTYINDLLPLAHSFHGEGYSCELIILKGHGKDLKELSSASYSDWYEQISNTCKKYKSIGKEVYLVGFSIGAALSLDYASRNDVKGVIAIEAFLSKTYNVILYPLFNLYKLSKKSKIKRLLRTTHERTKDELCYNTHFPIDSVDMIKREADRVKSCAYSVRCPVLFFHSVDDAVADYKSVYEFSENMSSKSRVITFRQLSHFLQFDVSPSKMKDVILCFFNLHEFSDISRPSSEIVSEMYSQAHQEHRQWAEILFKLIFGFFTVFGVLLYYTLPEVLDATTKAPYYMISYTFVLSVYVTLGALYMFYMVRTIVHIKNFLEPLIDGVIPSKLYRHNKYMSTDTSQKITQGISIVLFAMPFILSILALIAVAYLYPNRLFQFAWVNLVLQSWFITSLVSVIVASKSLISISKYTRTETWGIHRPLETNYKMETLLARMYLVISPGCVKQPDIDLTDNAKLQSSARDSAVVSQTSTVDS